MLIHGNSIYFKHDICIDLFFQTLVTYVYYFMQKFTCQIKKNSWGYISNACRYAYLSQGCNLMYTGIQMYLREIVHIKNANTLISNWSLWFGCNCFMAICIVQLNLSVALKWFRAIIIIFDVLQWYSIVN